MPGKPGKVTNITAQPPKSSHTGKAQQSQETWKSLTYITKDALETTSLEIGPRG